MNISEIESVNPNFDPKSAGRWTNEEHVLFLQGLQLYNKQWKLIADLVKTRTVVQIRTHAQKYFLKLQKSKQINDKTYAQLASILRSDSIDSTVYNELNGSTGTTTSEGESDNERTLSITSESDKLPSIMFPKLLLTKSDSDLRLKAESPRKRSRESKATPKAKSSTAKSPKRSNGRSVSSSALNSLSTMSREVELLQEEDLGLSMEKFYEYLPYEEDGKSELDDNFFDRIEWSHANRDDDSDSRSQSPFSQSISHMNAVPNVFPNLNMEDFGMVPDPSSRDPSRSVYQDDEIPSYYRPNLKITMGSSIVPNNSVDYEPSSAPSYSDDFSGELHFNHPLSAGFNFNMYPQPCSPPKSPRKRGRPKKYNVNGIAMDVSGNDSVTSADINSEITQLQQNVEANDILKLTVHLPEVNSGQFVRNNFPSSIEAHSAAMSFRPSIALPNPPTELKRISEPSVSNIGANIGMEIQPRITIPDLLPLASAPHRDTEQFNPPIMHTPSYADIIDSVPSMVITDSHY